MLSCLGFLGGRRQDRGVLPALARLFLRGSVVLLIANEVRGLVLAAPVLYAIYEAGGTLAAVWVGVCSLAGIIASVLAPLFIARRLKLVKVRRGTAI